MVGAIELARAFRDCCKAHSHPACKDCPLDLDDFCDKFADFPEITDADINKLIERIMAWKRQQET